MDVRQDFRVNKVNLGQDDSFLAVQTIYER